DKPTTSGDAELPAVPFTGRRESLGGHELGHVRRLEERPDFDLALARHVIGGPLRPGHRLVHVLDLPDREAGDQLAGLGERPVDDSTAGTFADDALGLGAVLEAGAGHEYAGLDQLLDEPVHRRERLGGGWRTLVAVLSGFREHHNPHRLPPWFEPAPLSSHWNDERACWKSTSFCKFFADLRVQRPRLRDVGRPRLM